MSGRLGNYLELVREAQKKRLQITSNQKKQIAELFRQSAKDFEREAGKKNEKSLTYRWLKDYAKNLRKEGKKLFQEIGDITAANIQNTSEAITEAERRFYTKLCPLLSERFSDVFSTIPKKMVEELMNGGIYKDFAGLSERIWDYQRKYDWDIQTIINRGIVQQKPAYDLAKDLECYLRPDAKKPWNWGVVYPGVNRQVDYHAQRLARTAVTHAYQLSLQRSTRDNPFVEGYRWHSSNSGRVCPLCRKRDGTVFEKGNLPLDHPNGMCVVTAEIPKSYEEIGKELGDWAAGKSDNPELDRWLIPSNEKERGNYSSGIKRIGTNSVNLEYIKSQEFRKKFNKITNHTRVNEALREYATAMLVHRKDTDGEDLYIIDSQTAELLLRKISGKNELEVGVLESELEKIRERKKGSIIGIHNHPTNIYPTGSDFAAAGYRQYDFGIVVTHDGRVFKYSTGDKPFLPSLFDDRVDKYTEYPYNLTNEKAHEKVLNEFREEYGISWTEIK